MSQEATIVLIEDESEIRRFLRTISPAMVSESTKRQRDKKV